MERPEPISKTTTEVAHTTTAKVCVLDGNMLGYGWMEIVSSIVKDQLNRFIIEMGDFTMKKKQLLYPELRLYWSSARWCFVLRLRETAPSQQR